MTISFTAPGSRSAVQHDQTSGVQSGADTNDTTSPGIDTDVDFDTTPAIVALHATTVAEAASRAWGVPDAAYAADVDAAQQTNSMTVTSDTGTITGIRFTDDGTNGVLDGDDSGLDTVDGHDILLWADTTDPDTIVYGIDAVDGSVVFVIQMVITYNGDNSEATIGYNVINYEPIFHPDSTNPDEPVDLGDFLRIEASDISGLFDFSDLAATKFLFGVVGSTDGGFIVIGKDPVIDGDGEPVNGGGAGDLINTSKGGGEVTIGVNNQHFTADSNANTVEQGAYFTYTTGMAAGTYNDADNINISTLVSVDTARLQVSQTQAAGTVPPAMRLTALDYTLSNGQAFVGDLNTTDHGTQVDILTVNIYDSDPGDPPVATIDVTTLTVDTLTAFGAYTVRLNSDGSFDIRGLQAKDWVEWTTDGTHDRVLVEALSGKWDIGGFEIDQPSTNVTSVGQQIIFDDDAPSVTLVGNSGAMLVLDESVGPNTAEDPNSNDGAPLASQSITAAQYLTTNTGSTGTDTPGTDVWSLVDPAGADSGLDDTATGNSVFLFLESGAIVGREGTDALDAETGEEVVRFTIDSGNGTVTATQSRAVVHDDPNDPDEDNDDATVPSLDDPAMLSGSNKIVVQRTITDKDLDAASATVDLTAIFKFEDDGPTFDIALKETAVLPLDETVGDGDDGGGYIAQNTITANNLFTISNEDYGSDGMGAAPVSYAFQDPGTDSDSGLLDSVTGQKVIYNLVGGVIIGTTEIGGDEVIRYEIDATSGDVTGKQTRAITHPLNPDNDETLVHPGSFEIVIERTITDGDGDSLTKSLDVTVIVEIDDDGPAIAITGGSGAADGDLKVDGTMAVNSDSADLGEEGGSDQVKSIAITDYSGKATGTVVTNDVTLTAEQVSDTLVRYFEDVGPAGYDAGDQIYYTYELVDTGVDGIVDTATFTVLFAPPSTQPDFSLNDLPAGQNGFGLLASRPEPGAALDPDGPSLVIVGREADYDPDGTMTNMSDTINTSKGGGPTTIGVNNQMIDPASNKDANGEGVWFAYVENPVDDFVSGIPGGLTQGEADDFDNIQYLGGTVETDGAFFSVVQVQGNPKVATAQITAFDLPNDDPRGTGATDALEGTDLIDALVIEGDPATRTLTPVEIIEVTVENGGSVTYTKAVGDIAGEINWIDAADVAADPTLDASEIGSVIVFGISAGDTIHFKTNGDHDAALIDGLAGKFDIGDYGLDLFNPLLDLTLDFEVTITDNDNDPQVDTHSVLVEGDVII